MTREEAISCIKQIKFRGYLRGANPFYEQDTEALEMAIQALSQESITTTNNDEPIFINYPIITCDDAVSREAVLDTLDRMDKTLDVDRTVENYKDLLKESYQVLPPVTQKSGKWDSSCTCSVCGKWRILESEKNSGKYKFCPNCGAKMESEDKE